MISFFDSWLPFIYLYVGGLVFFLVGMILIRKTKAIDMRIKKNRQWWNIMIAGFFYYLILHLILIIAALYW